MTQISADFLPKPPLLPPRKIDAHFVMLALCMGTAILQTLIFAPISVWPLSFVCLVPWLIAIGASRRAPFVYLYSFLAGCAFFSLNMRWLYYATGVGYVPLFIYQALYYPLVACPLRHAVRRRKFPLAIAVPLIWTGSEILRGVLFSGFPWFFLSHSLYSVRPLIQISDIFGAYGVSFIVAAINGAIADWILSRMDLEGQGVQRRPVAFSGIFAACLLLACLIYGFVQMKSGTVTQGPKIVTIQGDYTMSVEVDEVPDREKREMYFAMMNAAAAEKADLYLLPETPWIMYLNPEARDETLLPSRKSFSTFHRFARENNAYVVTGSASLVRTPYDLLAKDRRYNSATIFHPDGREPSRYDKVHLVPFGEAIPFRFGKLHWLYLWFNRMMPFSEGGSIEYSLFPGHEFQVFEMKQASQPDRIFRYGVPICYEDVMPYVAREFTSGGSAQKRADFLLNISNDGWFGRGTQQPQHLATCVFRAVENRVGIVRSVNTGISAFIDPDGLVHDAVIGDPKDDWPGQCGYSASNVKVDSRYTHYSRYGDWFGWACAALWLAIYVDYWVLRARS